MSKHDPLVTVSVKTTHQRIGKPRSQVGKLIANHLHRKHMGKPSRLTDKTIQRTMRQDMRRRHG